MPIRYIDQLKDLKGKKVFIRVDFNVPQDDKGNITEDTRSAGAVPTITLRYPSGIPGTPGHNWADAIAMATPIAHKGSTAGAAAHALIDKAETQDGKPAFDLERLGAQLDGMVCLTSCDKTVPGQLMAAARLNIPTIVVPCGYQASGQFRGHHCDIEDVFITAMHAVTGKVDLETVVGMSREAIRSPGVCSGLGTANSMHIVCEALGMALPGSASIPASAARSAASRSVAA